MPVHIYVPGFLPSSGVLTAASVYAKSPVLTCAVQLMVELCLFTGLGKRKRVMDEKELMMPLELGYVQAAEKRKALIKKSTSECVEVFVTLKITSTHTWPQMYDIHCFCEQHCYFFILEIPGGGEKQESNRLQGGRRARWPTTPHVARN